jgi:prephenate dehydrogenase
MLKHLPENVDIIGTHPLFGPQSGKDGIEGLNIVVCPVRTKKNHNLIRFFSKELKLNVLERTPIVHDKQMAYVQALTHFVGRAVNAMDIPDVEQKTPAYQYLLYIKRNLGQDSLDLFLTIEKENPYAKEVRDQFIEELKVLNKLLEE